MVNLIELTKNDLGAFVADELKEPRFRAERPVSNGPRAGWTRDRVEPTQKYAL